MQHTYIALDLETTGLSATKDRILEIGAVMVENGEVTEPTRHLLIMAWRFRSVSGS